MVKIIYLSSNAYFKLLYMSWNFYRKFFEYFTSKPNAQGIFLNLHIKIDLKINIFETNGLIILNFFISIFQNAEYAVLKS